MAKGHPDWFGQPVFPRYGGALLADDKVDGEAGVVTPLVTVGGKGVIYGGHVYVVCPTAHTTDKPLLYLDDTLMTDKSFYTLSLRNIAQSTIYPLYLSLYDTTNHCYGVGISPLMSFESKIELKYDNKGADLVLVYYSLIYAKLP